MARCRHSWGRAAFEWGGSFSVVIRGRWGVIIYYNEAHRTGNSAGRRMKLVCGTMGPRGRGRGLRCEV